MAESCCRSGCQRWRLAPTGSYSAKATIVASAGQSTFQSAKLAGASPVPKAAMGSILCLVAYGLIKQRSCLRVLRVALARLSCR